MGHWGPGGPRGQAIPLCADNINRWQTPALPALEECTEQPQPASLRFSTDAAAGWLAENPLGVPTEREVRQAVIISHR